MRPEVLALLISLGLLSTGGLLEELSQVGLRWSYADTE
jgi:hypothetical protein